MNKKTVKQNAVAEKTTIIKKEVSQKSYVNPIEKTFGFSEAINEKKAEFNYFTDSLKELEKVIKSYKKIEKQKKSNDIEEDIASFPFGIALYKKEGTSQYIYDRDILTNIKRSEIVTAFTTHLIEFYKLRQKQCEEQILELEQEYLNSN